MKHQNWTVAAKRHRNLVAVALVALSIPLSASGRWLLDQAISAAPAWEGAIELIGGWLLGTLVGVVVILPLFYLWGLFKPK